jgi:hypothetical protein
VALDDYSRQVLSQLQLDAQDKPFYTPALLTYLRGVGLNLNSAQADAALARGNADRAWQESTQIAGQDYEKAQRNLVGSLATAGTLRSGEANRRFTEQGQQQSQRLASLDTGKAERLQAIDRAYRSTEDSLRQGTTERLMGAEQDEATRRATEEAQKRQQQALIDFYNRGGK